MAERALVAEHGLDFLGFQPGDPYGIGGVVQATSPRAISKPSGDRIATGRRAKLPLTSLTPAGSSDLPC